MSKDLMDTFKKTVEYFNKFKTENWESLEPLLHKNIQMKRLDEKTNNSYHEGREEVQKYFFGNGKDDQAVFKPDPNPDNKIIGDLGFVSGAATFFDITDPSKGDPTKDPTKGQRIAYSFTYERDSDGNWKEIHSWGKYEAKITIKSK
jgi:hypothetical protein